MKQELEVPFGLGVAGEHDFTSVSGGEVDIDRLDGGEFLQDGPGCQAAGGAFEPGFEGDLPAVGQE